MSYDDQEYSVQDGAPFELFAFVSQGGGVEYYFTTSDEEKEFGGKTYEPFHITRTIFDTSAVLASPATVDFTLPRKCDLADLYAKPYAPPTLQIRVWRGHEGSDDYKKQFVGKSETFIVKGDYFVIKAKPLIESLVQRVMCSNTFGKKCNNDLFDGRCKLIEADYTWTTTVTAISSGSVTVANDFNIDEALQFGDIIINGEYRTILRQAANVIKIRYPFTLAQIGDEVTLKQGCAKTAQACNDFGNFVNFGGYVMTPKMNPIKTASKPGLFTHSTPVVNR